MAEVGHFIGGKHVAATGGRRQDIMQPMDGTVRGQVALGSKADLRKAVENAKAAQPAWAATNPQRRVRVLMKFLDLVQREYDSLADLLAREHGKTIADAKGDIQRGLEVVEVCIGAPHMMKGEFTDGAGPGIDVYSMRQPLGVVAGITPFNFPAMIPLWKIAPAIAVGNAFILKPSERDPGVPMRIAELFIEAGLPAGTQSRGGRRSAARRRLSRQRAAGDRGRPGGAARWHARDRRRDGGRASSRRHAGDVIKLDDRGQRALFCGDALHHPLQVYAPHWNSRFCEIAAQALVTRRRLLEHCAEQGALLFPIHFGAPHVGAITADAAGFSLRFVDGRGP